MKFAFAQNFALSTFALVVLAGCNAAGDGVLPVSAVIQPRGGVEGAASTQTYECLNTGVSLLVTFSDGQRGNFTDRATWTSSNPSVARVSNGEEPVPGTPNAFYARGVVLPVAAGSTTITARYLTFTKSIMVNVGTPANVRIEPANASLATGSLLDLSVVADLDGVKTNLDGAADWAFTAPNTAVATIGAIDGTVTGVAAGGPLTARASFPGCGKTASTSITVSNLQSLAMSKEFPGTAQLVVGTSEFFNTVGTLNNGQTQNLTSQVLMTAVAASNTADAANSLPFSGSLNGLVFANRAASTATADKTTTVQASFGYGSPLVTVRSNTIAITPVAATLTAVAVDPTSANMAPGDIRQFKAIGTYTLAGGGTVSQDTTRHVGFASSDFTRLGVQSSTSAVNLLAGLAVVSSTAATGGDPITITATSTPTVKGTATVTVVPAAP